MAFNTLGRYARLQVWKWYARPEATDLRQSGASTRLDARGAREMNALLPTEVRERGDHTSERQGHRSGRLRKVSLKGAARRREITAEFGAGFSRSKGGG